MQEDPWVVIGSPPCTAFSTLNTGLHKDRGDPAKREKKTIEARVLLALSLRHLS